jgi:PAS domain S-box-containing protein
MDTPKILIVDDQIHALKGMSRIMTSAGYDTFEANNGEDCLKLAADHKPDLILLDVVLPDIDGRDVCARIKSNPETANIYVVLLSSIHVGSDSQAEALDHGADGYIARPIPNRELLARVKGMLRLKYSEKEAIFRRFIDSAPAAIAMFDHDMRYLAASRRWMEDYQLGDRDILGQSHYEIFPEIPKRWKDVHLKGLGGEVIKSDGDKFERKDGSLQWLRWEVRPWRSADGQIGGIVIFTDDITELKKAEHDLRLSKARLSLAQESAKAGVWEWDLQTNENFWSEELWSLYGLKPNSCEPSYEAWLQAIHPDDRANAEKLVREAASNGTELHAEWRVLSGEEDERWLMARGRPVYDDHDQATSYIGIVMDITDRKALEAERLEMERKLQHAQKLESLGVLAGRISHDFNNQLSVVLGNLELALKDLPPDSRAKGSVMNAIEAANNSVELSLQMLTYSGGAFYLPQDVDINELLNRTSDLLESTVPKHVNLQLEIGDTLPPIKGDADQIQRVVTNILDNALDAIGGNKGQIRLSTGVLDCDEKYLRHNRLEMKPEPGRFVFLEVTDTGCGMDTEPLHRLFDPFFTTKPNSRGLGLSEVMGIVKGHHGALFVISQLRKGTTIQVLLPVSNETQASSLTGRESEETRPSEPAPLNRRKTILMIEDEIGVRDFTIRRLNVLGYDTITAVDGEQGVRIFRERLNEIDLVILDFAMPRMNGVEAFEELIRIKPDVKVILCSGYTEEAVMKSFRGQPAAAVLHKPYTIEDLKGELDRLLGSAE